MKLLVTPIVLLSLSISLFAWPTFDIEEQQPQEQQGIHDNRSETSSSAGNVETIQRGDNTLTSTSEPEGKVDGCTVSGSASLAQKAESVTEPQKQYTVVVQELALKLKELRNSEIEPAEQERLLMRLVEKKIDQTTLAPTMAFLRLFDFSDPFTKLDGFEYWHASNQGAEHNNIALLLNDFNNPVRPFIPPRADAQEPIIKLNHEPKVIAPGKGYVTKTEESCEVPERIPTPEENKAVRKIIYDTFQVFFSDVENEEFKTQIEAIIAPENIEKKITPLDIGTLFAALGEKEQESFINTLDQFKNSDPIFQRLHGLPSPERLAYYEFLTTETKSSFLLKTLVNRAKGTFVLALPFLTGASLGAALNLLLQTDFPCARWRIRYYLNDFIDPAFDHEYNIFSLYNYAHPPNTTLSDMLIGYSAYVNQSHSPNHNISDYYHYLGDYIPSYNTSSGFYLNPYYQYFSDYNMLNTYNTTTTYYKIHPYMFNRTLSYYENYLLNYRVDTICWQSPDTIFSDIARSASYDAFYKTLIEDAYISGILLFSAYFYHYVPRPIHAIRDRIANFIDEHDNKKRIVKGVLISLIASPIAGFIAAEYRAQAHDTDDTFGLSNAYGLDSRSFNFGSSIGHSVGAGLLVSIILGKAIIDHFEAPKYFEYARAAWSSFRSHSSNRSAALEKLDQTQTRNYQIKEQLRKHVFSSPEISVSSTSHSSSDIQNETQAVINNAFKKILLERVDNTIDKCNDLIERLQGATSSLQQRWLLSCRDFFARRIVSHQQQYEMVSRSDNSVENFSEEPLHSLMEEGKAGD